MPRCSNWMVVGRSLVCAVYFASLLITSQAQDSNSIEEGNTWLDDSTDPAIGEKRRFPKSMKFGRRGIGRLQFGKRMDPEIAEDMVEMDDGTDQKDKRYYTDMLDNLYLEDLLQNLNVDRWKKRGRMTFGKRVPEGWTGKRMRLTFGKRDDEMIGTDSALPENEDEDKRARMTFGKREPEDEKRARMTFGKREPEDEKRARMTFGKREPEDEKRARMTFGKREPEDEKRARMTFGKRDFEDEKRVRMTFGKRDPEDAKRARMTFGKREFDE